MQGGFSEQGKLSAPDKAVHFPSPRLIPDQPLPQNKTAVDPTRSFLESEAMMRINFSAPPKNPRTDRRKSQSGVIPDRPRTPGEIIPEILQSEITRSLRNERKPEQVQCLSTDPLPDETKISDADNFILKGEQPSLNAMSLPETKTTATPEPTRASEQSHKQGKHYENYPHGHFTHNTY